MLETLFEGCVYELALAFEAISVCSRCHGQLLIDYKGTFGKQNQGD